MSRTAATQAAGAALFVLLAAYLSFPDKVFVFDGIMFSGIIERAVDEWRRELFNRRHLLFNPTLMGLRDLIGLFGPKVGGYALIQRVNAIAGAAGVFLFFDLVRRASKSAAAAALSASLLAFSAAYWSRATEGQVYMLMTLGAIATGWSAVFLLEKPSLARALGLAGAFALAMLFHAANVALAPAVLAAAWLAGHRDRRVWLAAPACGALVALAYACAFGAGALAHPLSFLSEATEQASLSSLAAAGGLGLGARLQQLFSSLGEAVAGPVPARVRLSVGCLLIMAFARAGERATRRRETAWFALVFLLWAGSCMALESLWLGGQFFWASILAALLGLSALAWNPPVYAAAAALALGAWNLKTVILPQSRLENNIGYARTVFVRDHTVPSSWVVVSGLGYPNQKVYLPYFAHRSREVLEYYLDRDPKPEALRKFSAFIQDNVERGIPLYLLPDLVDDVQAIGQVQKRWDVGPQDVRNAFGPGNLIETARSGDGFKVYLFAPARRTERLFAVLGYSVLTESDGGRLQETARLLRELAKLMTPAQRADAARVMRESDYGANLLFEGFSRYMSPESRRAADERLRRFAEYRKTADFQLRLGNILRYLGQTQEVKRAWTRAYELSGDKSLLDQIKKL